MLVGVPKEIKADEYRVGLVPSAVRELVAHGHKVLVERGAGTGAGLADAAYESAGAEIVAAADQVFARADLIVKVKEPIGAERTMLRRGQILFTYLHLAPDRALTEALLACGCTAIAYETVTSPNGTLPLLTPMSEVAGRMAPQAGARCLEKEVGGRGMLLGGAPGGAAAHVLILGGGGAGSPAAPVRAMKPGSAIVAVSIDQGGCAETSRPTTHSQPTYLVDGVVHYCVANMPGAVARTSAFALNNMTLPFVLALADNGYRVALGQNPHLRAGLNVHEGRITSKAVADALKLPYVPAEQALRM